MGVSNFDTLGVKVSDVKLVTFTIGTGHGVYPVDATAAAVVANLPTAVGCKGRHLTIKKVDASANAVTLDGSGSETIDGAATLATTTQWGAFTIASDGANWLVVGVK
jgi:hypothetical protein